jgi:hypothetical protein
MQVGTGLSLPYSQAGLSLPYSQAGLSLPYSQAGLSLPYSQAGLSLPGVFVGLDAAIFLGVPSLNVKALDIDCRCMHVCVCVCGWCGVQALCKFSIQMYCMYGCNFCMSMMYVIFVRAERVMCIYV